MSLWLQAGTQLRQRRQRSGRQVNHPANQVNTPHLLGDAVLYLQTGVHFKEVKAGRVAVVDKLHGTRAAVVDRLAEFYRRLAQRGLHAVRQVGRGRLFQHLLVTPLYRAVAHAEGNHLAFTVTKQLDFQVTRPLNVFFDKHARVAKVILAQAHHGIEGVAQLFRVVTDAHADPATTRGAFQHYRVAHFRRSVNGLIDVSQQSGAFEHRHAVRFRQRTGGMFQAKQAQLFRRGADKRNACGFAGFGKCGVFRQKTVARMNGQRTAGSGGRDDLFAHQIGVRRRALAQAQRLIRFPDMQAAEIGFGVDRHAADLHGAQGAQNAAGNRPAVCNQECRQHRSDSIVAGRPAENRLTHGRPWGKSGYGRMRPARTANRR